MSEPLFTVASTFRIHGRGLVLVGIKADQYGSIKIGDALLIKCPDDSVVHAVVQGVEYPPSVKWLGERPKDPRYGVLVDADEIPLGSVVMAVGHPADR